jgi:hypothetical protein
VCPVRGQSANILIRKTRFSKTEIDEVPTSSNRIHFDDHRTGDFSLDLGDPGLPGRTDRKPTSGPSGQGKRRETGDSSRHAARPLPEPHSACRTAFRDTKQPETCSAKRPVHRDERDPCSRGFGCSPAQTDGGIEPVRNSRFGFGSCHPRNPISNRRHSNSPKFKSPTIERQFPIRSIRRRSSE